MGSTSETNDGFFSRPIRISQFQWTPSTLDARVIDPWSLFLSDPRILNRITHFKHFRGQMRIKILYNGNPYYFGKMIVSYVPFSGADSLSGFSSSRAYCFEETQRAHVFLDACESEPADMTLEYLYDEHFVTIPDRDFSKLGRLVFHDITGLWHARGEMPDPITISVFAYMENVELYIPTASKPNPMIPQGGESEGFSSSVGKAASSVGVLSKIPVLKPYATAASTALELTAIVAKMFGFSRPVVTRPVQAVTQPHNSLAVAQAVDFSHPLSLYTDHQVAFEPGKDEMALLPHAMKQTYIGQFEWSMQDAVDSHLASISVDPSQRQILSGSEIHMSPSAWVAEPFRYWRGSMKFRFQFVLSAYHRGRVRIVWEPHAVPGAVAPPENVVYSEVVDISATKDFVMEVGWGHSLPYLLVPGIGREQDPFSQEPFQSREPGCNGILSVYVLNSLMAPGPSDPVQVIVSASMCHDFEVCVPQRTLAQSYEVKRFPYMEPEGGTAGLPPVFSQQSVQSIDPAGIWINEEAPTKTNLFSRVSNNNVQRVFIPTGTTTSRVFLYNFNSLALLCTLYDHSGGGATGTMTVANVSKPFTLGPMGSAVLTFPDIQATSPFGTGAFYPVTVIVSSGASISCSQMTWDQPTDLQRISNPCTDLGVGDGWTVTDLGGGHSKISKSGITTMVLEMPNDMYPHTPFTFCTYDGCRVAGTSPLQVALSETDGTGPWDGEGGRWITVFPGNDRQIALAPNNPTNTISFGRYIYFKDVSMEPQSGEIEEMMETSNDPENLQVDAVVGNTAKYSYNANHFAEVVPSFRTLLKRFFAAYRWNRISRSASVAFSMLTVPQYPSSSIGTVLSGETLEPLPSLFHWVTPCFICLRGGMKLHLTRLHSGSLHDHRTVFMREHTSEVRPAYCEMENVFPANLFSEEGTTIIGAPFLCVNSPYYNPKLFYPGRDVMSNWGESEVVRIQSCSVQAEKLLISYSIDEDFNLGKFLSTPIIIKPA